MTADFDGPIDRDRQRAAGMAAAAWSSGQPLYGHRQLVRVYDGGAFPTSGNRVFLTRPAVLDADEAEGASWSAATDDDVTIPVLVLGSRAPSAGDLLVAHAVAGRWVAELGAPGNTLACWPCAIPKEDLAVDWTNSILGDGSATLSYTPPGYWASGCENGLLYRLACNGSIVEFGAAYFISGECPTGQWLECVSGGAPPFSLQLASYACDPFELIYTLTGSGCPFLWGSAYTQFRVYKP